MAPVYKTHRSDLPSGRQARFTAGKGYYAGPPKPKPPSQQQLIQQQVSQYQNTLPAVQTQAQIAQAAQSQIDPLIAALSSRIEARAKAGAGAIQGYTGQLASQLGGAADQARNIYAGAEASQAGSDSALAQMLSGTGSDLAAGLGQKLTDAGLGQPVIDKTTGLVKETGQGAAGALYGTGSASLSDLIARGAHAQEYGAKLPGIADLGGIQGIRDVNLKAGADLADQSAQVQQQLPGLISSLQAANENRATNRATQGQALNEYLTNRADTIAANKSAAALEQYKFQTARADAYRAAGMKQEASMAQHQADLAYKYASLNSQNQRSANTIAAQNSRTAAQIDAANNRAQLAAKKAGVKATGKGALTQSQLSTLIDKWKTGKVQNAHVAQTDANGAVVRDSNGAIVYKTQSGTSGQLSFTQAYKRLVAFGKSDQEARKLLDTAYKRGEQGRSWVTNEEQAALAKANQPPKAHVVNGHGVLTPAQYQALKKANRLPPGQLTAEGAYVIASTY